MDKLNIVAISRKTKVSKVGLLEEYKAKADGIIPEGYIGVIFSNNNIDTQTTLSLSPKLVMELEDELIITFKHTNPGFKLAYKEGEIIAQVLLLKV